jgi:CrcB protein
LVALGGALGALLRYGCLGLTARWSAAGVPLAILIVNVSGSFLAGWTITALIGRTGSGENLRLFAVAGVLGAFTTFSAFSWENYELIRVGSYGRAAVHAILQVSLSVAAVALGAWAAR